jgi:hypothetical protein
MLGKLFGFGVIAAGVIIVIIMISRSQDQEVAKREELKAALEVSELPENEAKVWKEFVRQSFQSKVKIVGSQFVISDSGARNFSRSYVSVSHPYSISCYSGGIRQISINFGGGDGAPSINILGYRNKGGPSLSVNKRSVAAKKQLEELCDLVAEMMAKASTSPQ